MTDRRKEDIKNVSLVVLFLTTILFLYLLWTADARSSFNLLDIIGLRSGDAEVPAAEEILTPKSVILSDGSGVYHAAVGNSYKISQAASDYVTEACERTTVGITEINEMQFTAVMARYDSVQIALCCDVPFADFVKHHSIRIGTAADSINDVSLIAFSEASRDSIFICDAPAGRFFRLRFNEDHEYTASLIAMCEKSSDSYYFASDILGYGKAFIPVDVESSLTEKAYVTDAAAGGRELRNSMAEAVMGENFDFVRRISDGFGNIIYMYGYGQKTFSASADGSFEYSAEVSSGNAGDFYSDLNAAVTFIARCGGWPEGSPSLVLDKAEQISSARRSGHKYYFVQMIDGVPVRGEGRYSVEVEIINGQVSYFRRCTLQGQTGQSSGRSRTAEAVNVIASNCNHIYNVLNNNTLVAAADEAFSFVSAEISDIRQGYFNSTLGERLVPCWIVRTRDGSEFFFDLYDASPLGFSRQEQDGLE